MSFTYGTWTSMTVTNLALANDATDVYAGWQSDMVDNTSVKADDYEIRLNLPCTAAPANDQAAYVYVLPWQFNSTGSVWLPAGNFGTTVQPTTSEGTANISDPNSMKGPLALPYKLAGQVLQGFLNISAYCGGIVPDGWSLAIRDATGSSFTTGVSSGIAVSYRPITFTT